MTYSEITTGDANPLKRWLQRRRLGDALRHALAQHDRDWPARALDFGGGNGALSLRLRAQRPSCQIACYEPAPSLRAEAAQLLAGTGVLLLETIEPDDCYDLVLCCEVLEHLPPLEVHRALTDAHTVLAPSGRLVVGLPNELFGLALVKGLFRMARRRGEYDARFDTIAAAAIGRPRPDRPIQQLDGLPFIYHHAGFDYRTARRQLEEAGFTVSAAIGSPFPALPLGWNAEVYFVCRPA
jgi:SAM-dependent methyltransferase